MTLRGTATVTIDGVEIKVPSVELEIAPSRIIWPPALSIRPTVMFVSCKGDLLYRRRQAEYEAWRVWTDRRANWRRVKREMRKAARAVRP